MLADGYEEKINNLPYDRFQYTANIQQGGIVISEFVP